MAKFKKGDRVVCNKGGDRHASPQDYFVEGMLATVDEDHSNYPYVIADGLGSRKGRGPAVIHADCWTLVTPDTETVLLDAIKDRVLELLDRKMTTYENFEISGLLKLLALAGLKVHSQTTTVHSIGPV